MKKMSRADAVLEYATKAGDKGVTVDELTKVLEKLSTRPRQDAFWSVHSGWKKVGQPKGYKLTVKVEKDGVERYVVVSGGKVEPKKPETKVEPKAEKKSARKATEPKAGAKAGRGNRGR